MEMSSIEIGMRVSDLEGFYGTVRYIGPVAVSKVKTDIWVGVEWDSKDRGKHDGSVLDDSDALYKKYKETSNTEESTENYALTAAGKQKPIEFIGEENIRKWQQLNLIRQVTLPMMGISHAGDGIKEIAGHFTYVDIQKNLLHKWSDVGQISLQIPSVESLYILGNKMDPLTNDVAATLPPDCLAHIKTLCISKCSIHSWTAIEVLHSLASNLVDIFATHNNFSDIPLYDGISTVTTRFPFACLKRLDVSNSGVLYWSQILTLGALPALQELLADENPIPSTSECPEGMFRILSRFSLSAIRIQTWADIDNFASYPALRNLRVSEVPFLVSIGISEARAIIIARVNQINYLNGSPISEKERSAAETTYVRHCLRDFDEHTEGAPDRVIASRLHPRFEELYKKFAASIVSMGKPKTANTIQNDLLDVTLQNLSFVSNGSLEPMSKRLPSSLQVVRLRQLVRQIFGLDPVLQQLSYQLLKDAPPILLDDDDLTLAQFGVTSGSVIYINEAKASV